LLDHWSRKVIPCKQ